MARFRARDSKLVPNARLELVPGDPLTLFLLRHLDGEHDRASLVEVLVHGIKEKNLVFERHGWAITDPDHLRGALTRELDPNLRRLARSALLVG